MKQEILKRLRDQGIDQRNDVAITTNINNEGYQVVIAKQGEKGCYPTGLTITGKTYQEAQEITMEVNHELWPEKDDMQHFEIIMRSL
jgi:hypothetical protein